MDLVELVLHYVTLTQEVSAETTAEAEGAEEITSEEARAEEAYSCAIQKNRMPREAPSKASAAEA